MDISLYMNLHDMQFLHYLPTFLIYRRPTKFSSFLANSPENFSRFFEATGSHVCQSWPWHLTLWPKIDAVPLLINHKWTYMWSLKVMGLKTAVCIMSTRFHTPSTKDDLDLWTCDPKSIGFLFPSCTTYMWSLKVIKLKLQSVSCPQGFKH